METELRETADDCPDGNQNPLMDGPSSEIPTAATTNEFTARKSVAHTMMDAALFMANISQLRMLLTGDSATIRFFIPLLCLIAFSILCQILFALLILVMWARGTGLCKKPGSQRCSPQNPHSQPPHLPAPTPSNSPTASGYHAVNGRSMGDIDAQLASPSVNGTSRRQRGPPLRPSESALLNCRLTSVDFDGVEDDAPVTSGGGDVGADVTRQRLHVVTLLLVFLITIANMFITGLGFESADGRSPASGV